MNRRTAIATTAVLLVEGYAYLRYAQFGTQFHFWLHLLHGAAAGLTTWVAVAALRARSHDQSSLVAGAVTAGFAGHVFTAVPDVLFLTAGLLHARWMDVFAVHIRIHMVLGALWVSLLLLALALGSWLALSAGRRRLAGAGVLAVVLTAGTAIAVAPPVPTTLAEVQALDEGGLWCPLVGVDD